MPGLCAVTVSTSPTVYGQPATFVASVQSASYVGDNNVNGSASTAVTQTVNPTPTSVTVTSNANPSTYGQSVTFAAAVQAAFGTAPPSTISFYDGTTLLGTVNTAKYSNISATNHNFLFDGRHTLHHSAIRRQLQFCEQHLSGFEANRKSGQHDHDRFLEFESIFVRPAGDADSRSGFYLPCEFKRRRRHVL